MCEGEESHKVDRMPPKEMRKDVIVDLVKNILEKANLTEIKGKRKVTKWGDESDEEDESQIGETTRKGKEVEMDKY